MILLLIQTNLATADRYSMILIKECQACDSWCIILVCLDLLSESNMVNYTRGYGPITSSIVDHITFTQEI